ncbi:uncharacterized protein K02A2.6-like [Rhipicephalus sanguineus]|uniref:uncharacterized protein K02A2.6-like n=1 Tax=Rhipicephalus sanguineus TaxID=34632 RepID=UPI0018961971|nr:uncharacterized protein K02A2.6-like [Rhipicephalus sanguineus]
MGSRPPAFDGAAGSWGTYRIRLEAFFEGHEVTDPGKRRALLISSLSESVVRILQGRNPSTPVNTLSYDQVVECLEDQYNPQANEIAASYAFFMRKQKEGESVRDFIAELRRLAESCNFGSMMDRMLRDRIVCGIRDDDARRSLLTRATLTLKEAEDFARASEEAQEDVRDMQETGVGNGSGTMNALLRLRRRESRAPSSNLESSRPLCERCDGPHDSNVCRHRNTKCRMCGRKGHLARVCRRSRSRTSGAYVVEEYESESEEFMLALVAHSATDRDVSRPLEKVLTWGGQELSMIIDTGSPVSVIPVSVYERHRRRWPALAKTALRLSCFLGPLPVIGKLTMDVKSGTVTVTSKLVVVGCQGPLLCGRRTIEEFGKAGVSLLDANSAACVNFVQQNAQLKALLDEFSQLFDNKLGCCEGPPVKLHIKEGARPRFCKARTVPYAMRAQVSAENDRLVEGGVLSQISVSEWATPVVPVAKKNGDIRLCGDFKLTVNPATYSEQYPLPKVDDIFAALAGGEVFSTLDLRNAHNQLPLDAEAKRIAVLNTHKGLYCYNRLAFGIDSAPALFQRRMESVLRGLPGVKVYLDDIIVAEKKHDMSVLRQVFQRLQDSGLKLNKTKCRFREKQVTFLGHRIDEKGLHLLQDNLGAILGAPSPTSCMPLPAAQVPSSWPETDKRWSRLHVDFAGPVEGHMILVLVDAGFRPL